MVQDKNIIVNPDKDSFSGNSGWYSEGRDVDPIPVFQKDGTGGVVPYLLHLDDERTPWDDRVQIPIPSYFGDDSWEELDYNRVVWAQDYEEFVSCVKFLGVPYKITFDHDLGSGRDGKDAANWLIDNRILPKEISVHSANPVGAKDIRSLMRNAKRFQDKDSEEWNNTDSFVISYTE